MQKEIRPLGLSVIGGINFFIFGLGSLILFSYVYLNSGSDNFQTLLAEITKHLPEVELKEEIVKKAILAQIAVASIFALSGWGLLQGKEVARKSTLWFAFFVVTITFVSCLFNPAMIGGAFFQIVYPGVLIIYLTNKKVEKYFKSSKNIVSKEIKS